MEINQFVLCDVLDGCNTEEEINKLIADNLENAIAQIQTKSGHGHYPLFLACQVVGYENLAISIFEKYPNAIKNQIWDNSRNPLHIACDVGNTATVTSIIDSFRFLCYKTDLSGRTPLFYACKHDFLEILYLFFEKVRTIQINQQDINGQTLLHVCCQQNSLNIINFLLQQRNIDVDIADNLDKTAFFYFVSNYICHHKNEFLNKIILRRFLQYYPNAINYIHRTSGATICHDIITNNWHVFSDSRNRLSALLTLTNTGNMMNMPDNNGMTPLHLECMMGADEIGISIDFILDHSCSSVINQVDNLGRTALHYAFQEMKELRAMKLIRHANIRVDIQDFDGNLALHLIICNDNIRYSEYSTETPIVRTRMISELLFNHEHLVLRRNNCGLTAYHLAEANLEKIKNLNNLRTSRNMQFIDVQKFKDLLSVTERLEDILVKVRWQVYSFCLESV
jgi:ankyrin repeat protein